jgi:hypothetical protein
VGGVQPPGFAAGCRAFRLWPARRYRDIHGNISILPKDPF